MAKLKRKFIRMRVEEESVLSRDELTAKLDALIDAQYRRDLSKLKGSPLCLWSKPEEDCYRLRYYRSYREDMCDTQLTIDIEKGLERCNIYGIINKPASIWAMFWGVIASVFIDFLVITWLILFGENFDLTNGLMVSGAICLVRVYICTVLIEIDREQVRILREELLRVIHNKKQKSYFERADGDERIGTDVDEYGYEDENDDTDENGNGNESGVPDELL